MKKITLSILTLALASGAWAQLDRSVKPKPGPAPTINLGNAQSFTLANGMKVFVVENHKLPTIACSIELDIKPELQGDMTGYRDMMSELLLGGTKTRSKDKLNAEIDQMGATIVVNDEGLFGSGLKKYQDKIMDLMSDIAMNAVIKADELTKVKTKTLSELETQKNQPDAMVSNVSQVVNFGHNHPYGEVATEETVKKISLEQCNKYYQTYFRPNVAYMAIVGDVTMAEVKPLVEKYFGKWQKKNVPVAGYTIPKISDNSYTKVAFAPRTAAVQSVVSVTYPVDLKPGTPDVIKARVANTVLGGGSQGRLFLDLREKHAWTYGAYSSLRDDELGGTFSATVKCRNVVSDSSIEAILTQMRLMQTTKVTPEALQNSITYLSGNFAIGLEDPKRVAQNAINVERYHMPKDYYQNYLKNLSAVTPEDVMAVSMKYIRPDHANIVVAGSKDEVASKLSRFSQDGKIDYYDYAGKPIIPASTMAAPTNMTAEDVHKKYIAALGGEAGFNSVKDLRVVGSSTIQGMPLTITEVKKAPNMWMQMVEYSVGGQKMVAQKQAFNGAKGYQEAQGHKADLAGEDLDQVLQDADFTAELHPEKFGIKRTLKGMETVSGKSAYVVDVVNAKGKKSVEYYDATTGLLIRKVQGEGDKLQTSDYADYKDVPGTAGYKVPYTVIENAGGMTFTETVTTVEANKGVADTEFN